MGNGYIFQKKVGKKYILKKFYFSVFPYLLGMVLYSLYNYMQTVNIYPISSLINNFRFIDFFFLFFDRRFINNII